jgi:2-methylcitrate dehydratase PrpD
MVQVTLSSHTVDPMGLDPRYLVAFNDWLGCAHAGRDERAARAAAAMADGLAGRVLAAATAGHVLDFDDTYAPGLAHLSAPTAPAALVLGAELGATMGDVLDAYAAGFEAMGALTRASHPALYERGWHPTAVCGTVGAAVAASRLIADCDERVAARLALVHAGGLRSAFGSDGKALQVGAAAAAGVNAARLAALGATISEEVRAGFEEAYGSTWAQPSAAEPAIAGNWIKAYPCCLQTHSAIETAAAVRGAAGDGPLTVTVHPRARQAAAYDDVANGLEAKFSIPYTFAYTLLNGPPSAASAFDRVEEDARTLARARVEVALDESLPENGALLSLDGGDQVRVDAALGSPARPLSAEQLDAKLAALGASHLAQLVSDPATPARDVVAAAFELG